MRKIQLTVIAILMAAVLCICGSAGGEGAQGTGNLMQPMVKTIAFDAEFSNDAAAEQYIDRLMYGAPAKRRGAEGIGYSKLNDREQALYQALVPLITSAANGETASTSFSIPVASIFEKDTYTFEEAGISNGDDSWTGCLNLLDYGKVFTALLTDFPYEMYWYDTTAGIPYSYPFYIDPEEPCFITDYESPLVIDFYVSADYSIDGTTMTTAIDTTFGQSAQAATENAQTIVTRCASLDDIGKLVAYKNAICALTDYNEEAAYDNTTPYGNPWQMIWVFDGNEATTVVCEGYSKAFQYLCDQSTFATGDVQQIVLAYGTMDGGPHMWNLVTLSDGNTYLADVTNSDSGSIGSGGGLFLAGYDETETLDDGRIKNGYTVMEGTQWEETIWYTFDPELIAFMGEETLTMTGAADYPLPTLNAPVFTVLADFEETEEYYPVTQGQMVLVTVEWDYAQLNAKYYARLEELMNNEWVEIKAAQEINPSFPALYPSAGFDIDCDYRITVTAEEEGFESAAGTFIFWVDEASEPIPTARLDFAKDHVDAGEGQIFCGYVQGADRIMIEYSRSGDPEWHNWYNFNGEAGCGNNGFFINDTYSITLYGYDSDKQVIATVAKTLTLQGSEADLSPISLYGVPDTIEANTGISGYASVEMPEGNWPSMVITLRRLDPEANEYWIVYSYWAETDSTGRADIIIPPEYLAEAGTYKISVESNCYKHSGSVLKKVFEVTETPQISDPTFTIQAEGETLAENATVLQGQWLTIVPTSTYETQDHLNVEYSAAVEKQNAGGEWENAATLEWDFASRTIMIPTYEYTEGIYRIRVFADAEGYTRHESRPFVFSFEENNDYPDLRIVFPNTSGLITGDGEQYYVYAKNAMSVSIVITNDSNPNLHWYQYSEGTLNTFYDGYSEQGIFTYTVTAYYADSSSRTITATVEVLAPAGPQEPIGIVNVPRFISAGDSISGYFTWGPNETLTCNLWGYVTLGHYVNGSFEYLYNENRFQSWNEGTGSLPSELVFGADTFATPGKYILTVDTYAIGYEASHLIYEIYVTEDDAENVTMHLPADLERIEDNAFEGGDFQAVIIPNGCSYIGHGAFKNCTNLVYVSYPAGATIESDAFAGCDIWIMEPREAEIPSAGR